MRGGPLPALSPGRSAALLGLLALLLGPPSALAGGCGPSGLPIGPAEARTALVFSGGGAKAAYEVGVAQAFRERAVRLDVVAGASAGALVATMVVAGEHDALLDLWRTVTTQDVYRGPGSNPLSTFLYYLEPTFLTYWRLNRQGAIFDTTPLRRLIEERVDFEKVRASPRQLLVIANDLRSLGRRVFDNQTVSPDALLASVSIPIAFPPVYQDGEVLVDGGLTEPAPILETLERFGRRLDRAFTVFINDPRQADGPANFTLRDVIDRTIEMTIASGVARDTELARFRHPGVEIQVVGPSVPLGIRPLEFRPEETARAIEQGRRDALACLDQLGY